MGFRPPRDRPLNTLGIILISDRVDCMARARVGWYHTSIRQLGPHEGENSYCTCGLLAPRTTRRTRRSRSGDSAQPSLPCGLPLGCGCRHRSTQRLHFSALLAHLTFPSGYGGLAAGASSRPEKRHAMLCVMIWVPGRARSGKEPLEHINTPLAKVSTAGHDSIDARDRYCAA